MSLGRFRSYLKNPFLGTHSPRLVKETIKSVDLHIHKGPGRFLKKKKSLFDEAFGHHNFAGNSTKTPIKSQLASWKKISRVVLGKAGHRPKKPTTLLADNPPRSCDASMLTPFLINPIF